MKNKPDSAKGLKEYIANRYISQWKEIADLGCGQGFLSDLLKDKNQVFSYDLEKNYDSCILKDLNKDFELEKEFDIIFAIELIEHLENPRHFIRECKKYLKKNGKIIITTPIVDDFKQRLYYLIKGDIYGFRDLDYEISGHITPMTKKNFKNIARELNLNIKMSSYKENLIVELLK